MQFSVQSPTPQEQEQLSFDERRCVGVARYTDSFSTQSTESLMCWYLLPLMMIWFLFRAVSAVSVTQLPVSSIASDPTEIGTILLRWTESGAEVV